MNFFAKSEARKNTKISFRTDDETLAQLKSICRIENRTISSLIESILAEHVLVHEHPLVVEQEKRQAPRKKCSIPTVLTFKTNESTRFYNGTILCLSSNSVQIVVKNLTDTDELGNEFDILFTIPKTDYPLLINNILVRHKCIDNECIIISKIVHNNFMNLDSLDKYLASNEFNKENEL